MNIRCIGIMALYLSGSSAVLAQSAYSATPPNDTWAKSPAPATATGYGTPPRGNAPNKSPLFQTPERKSADDAPLRQTPFGPRKLQRGLFTQKPAVNCFVTPREPGCN
ncbi:hypothetical protein [Dyella tabacisoli]|uniref:Uncharacterized protein n=1 Tax=Dyella tabacisoli TaxID=2282381 RepID=A0A369ULT4_9GAMM|nr:hypothetical protein [Dyella tabacisoli]RDD81467.1 hypothetical protein DVJ77_09775 [Dyella tabacisoli]